RRIRTDPAGRRQLHHAGCQRREPGGGAGEAERGRKRRQWSTRPTVAAQPVSRRPDRGVTPGGAESAAARSGTVRQPERRGPDRARARRQPLSRLRSLTAGELRPMKHLDRKSTRLNSSHVKISYAVFCLKKKKSNCT